MLAKSPSNSCYSFSFGLSAALLRSLFTIGELFKALRACLFAGEVALDLCCVAVAAGLVGSTVASLRRGVGVGVDLGVEAPRS